MASLNCFGQVIFQVYMPDQQVSKIQHLNQHQQDYLKTEIMSAFVEMQVKKANCCFFSPW